ncbi:MAG: ATP-binding protein [Candidatus Sedimenticola sp. (ex Thyasira tokunagai)]
MIFEKTKKAVIRALRAENTPVIALTGSWGTGKTYLWHHIARELESDGQSPINEIYITALSTPTLPELKRAVEFHLASLIVTREASETTETVDQAQNLAGAATSFVSKLVPEGVIEVTASLGKIFLSKAKSLLPKDKQLIIAIDDIERTHSIDIAELLGYISYLTSEIDAKVVVILNSQKLKGERASRWSELREKMISLEIQLAGMPDEAITETLDGLDSLDREIIIEKARILDIQNIRIYQHIRRRWDAIRNGRAFDEAGVHALLPSVVLLSAMNYSALNDWPDLDFLKKKYTPYPQLLKNGSEDSEEKNRLRWNKMITDYLEGAPLDDFEKQVLIPFLETGHLDNDKLSEYLNIIDLRIHTSEAGKVLDDWWTKYSWASTLSPEEILDEFEKLRTHIEC